MKTPKMMLDSTIGKILMLKEADTSIQIDSADEPKQGISNPPEPGQPEAEVRLVVRFIVEEHIVYKGKVQRVHQLESEELSRVVSRVAWDDTKDGNSPDLVANFDKVPKDPDVDFVEIDPQSSQNKSFDNTTAGNSDTTSLAANVSTSPNDESSSHKEAITTTQNTESSDHDAYVKSNENSSHASPVGNQDANFIAQVNITQTTETNISPDCDKTPERSSGDANGKMAIAQYLQNSPPASETSMEGYNQGFSSNMVPSNTNFGLDSNPTPESIEDLGLDSQSVAETLNDCVNNVDLESREKDNSPKSATTEMQEQIDLKPGQEQIKLQGQTVCELWAKDEVECHVDKDANVGFSPEIIYDQDQKLTPVSTSSECMREEIVHSMQTCSSNDSTISNAPSKEDVCTSSSKRKSVSEHNQSGKRIRKTNPKERNLNTRTSANRTIDNSSSRQSGATPRQAATKSLLATNEQFRHHKVFAKWTDNHFYPGTILKPARDRKFVIGFFDGAQRNVSEVDLIPLCNIEGKHVRVSIAKNYCVNAIVHGQCAPVNDQPMFDVEYQQDGLVRTQVPLKDIFLTGEQGTPLISQTDKNSGESNFADVDLDNIIYEKRSRRLQDLEEFYFSNSTNHRTKTPSLLL